MTCVLRKQRLCIYGAAAAGVYGARNVSASLYAAAHAFSLVATVVPQFFISPHGFTKASPAAPAARDKFMPCLRELHGETCLFTEICLLREIFLIYIYSLYYFAVDFHLPFQHDTRWHFYAALLFH